MSITAADDVSAVQVIEFPAAEAIDHARGNSQRAQHDGHGSSKIFAVALLALEEEVSQRISRHIRRQIQSVAEVCTQIKFDGPGPIIIGGGVGRGLFRKDGNPRIKAGKLKVYQAYA